MNIASTFVLLASYNEWMNQKLYEAASRLSPEELAADRHAFFGSLLGTLNHIVVGDTLWLKRFATHPSNPVALQPVQQLSMPASLDQLQFTSLDELADRRRFLDGVIKQWVASFTESDLQQPLRYANTKGVVSQKDLAGLVLHFFNHQTHHRGQATALLSQAGQDVGVTDLLMLIPNQDHAGSKAVNPGSTSQ